MAVTPEQLAKPGTEHAHQAAFFASLVELGRLHPCVRWVHAVPNGGERDAIVAGRMKAEGVRAGVWDVYVPIPIGRWHGMWIEFKKPTRRKEAHGGLSDKQVEFGLAMHGMGYHTALCYTWGEARAALVLYLTGGAGYVE